jgi:hypothetical protein
MLDSKDRKPMRSFTVLLDFSSRTQTFQSRLAPRAVPKTVRRSASCANFDIIALVGADDWFGALKVHAD